MPIDRTNHEYVESVFRALADLLDFRRENNLPIDPFAPSLVMDPLALLVMRHEVEQREAQR